METLDEASCCRRLLIISWSSGSETTAVTIFSLLMCVRETGDSGDIRPLGLLDLGVSMPAVSSDDRDSGMMWSPKWALNSVETGRRRRVGNSCMFAGALWGCCAEAHGRKPWLRSSLSATADVDARELPLDNVLIDKTGGARLGLVGRSNFRDGLSGKDWG